MFAKKDQFREHTKYIVSWTWKVSNTDNKNGGGECCREKKLTAITIRSDLWCNANWIACYPYNERIKMGYG